MAELIDWREAPAPAGDSTPPGDDGRIVRLAIPALAEYVILCRLALTGLCRLRPFSEEQIADLKLALTEAASNAVRHAYGDESVGVVEIVYGLHADRLVIEVVDDGNGFDPQAPAADHGAFAERGLGMAIIRAVVDDVEICPQNGRRGSRLRLTKMLT